MWCCVSGLSVRWETLMDCRSRERERERAAHYSTSQTEVRTLRLGVERQSDEETGEREDDRFVL